MLMVLFTVSVSVFAVICIWSAFEIYLDRRKKANLHFQKLSQTTDENQ